MDLEPLSCQMCWSSQTLKKHKKTPECNGMIHYVLSLEYFVVPERQRRLLHVRNEFIVEQILATEADIEARFDDRHGVAVKENRAVRNVSATELLAIKRKKAALGVPNENGRAAWAHENVAAFAVVNKNIVVSVQNEDEAILKGGKNPFS